MPLASLELFDSDSEEPPPKRRRRGELELLTSGAGYFAIPIVKSRRYNLRPRKLQSSNKHKHKLGGAKKPAKAINAPPEALRRNRAERAAEFAKRIDMVSELALKKKSNVKTENVERRNQKITLTVNILRYKMEIPDIEIVDHDGNPRKSVNAAKKRGGGYLHHYTDSEGNVLQVTRKHAITTTIGEMEDSLKPEPFLQDKIYMDPKENWNIQKLPHDVRQTFEFLETNSPPDAIVFTELEEFEHVEPFDRANVLNEDDEMKYVFTPYTTATIDLKESTLQFISPLEMREQEARKEILVKMCKGLKLDDSQEVASETAKAEKTQSELPFVSVVSKPGIGVQSACGYKIIIALYAEAIKEWQSGKLGQKRFTGFQATYEGIWKLIRTTTPFDSKNLQMTMRDFAKVMEFLKVSVTFLDIRGKELTEFSYKAPGRSCNLVPSHIWIMQHNNHLYYIGDSRKRVLSKTKFAPASFLNVELPDVKRDESVMKPLTSNYKFKFPVDDRLFLPDINCLRDLEIYKTKAEIIRIAMPIDPSIVFSEFIERGYEPRASLVNGKIINLRMNIQGKIVVIAPPDSPAEDADSEIMNEVEFSLYCKHDHAIRGAVMRNDLLSHYSEGLGYAIRNYSRASIYVGTSTEDNVVEHDLNKAFASCLNNMRTVGVFEIFDEWESYDNKAIVDTALYLVHDSPGLTFEQRLILDAEINLLDGRTLKLCTKWPNFKPSQIIQVVYPSKLGELTVASELKALWDSDLPLEHKKFIPNKIVGQLGKRYNKRSNTIAFQNQAEAEHYHESLRATTKGFVTILKRPLGTRKIYFVSETDSRNLIDGFYPLQIAVYNQTRVALYEKVIEIKARGGVIQGVKADAIYEKARGNETEIPKVHSYAAMGTWSLKMKRGVKFPDACELKASEELPKVKAPLDPIIIKVSNEWDTASFFPELDKHSRVLIRGNTAGTGKTNLLVQYAKIRGKTLFVTPQNLLAFKLRSEDGVPAITLHNLMGLRPTADEGEETETTKRFDISEYSLIVFDEIFFYTSRQHAKIKEFMDEHADIWNSEGVCSERKFFSAGDTFQNLPFEKLAIADPRAYYTENMERLFPAHITLEINKRLKTEADRTRISEFKKDCFDLPRQTVVKKYFTSISDARETKGKAICFTNEDKNTVNKLMHKKAVNDRKERGESVHEKEGCPTYYVGMLLNCEDSSKKSKGKNVFFRNFTYRIEEISEWGAKLWDFNANQVSDGTKSEFLEATYTQLAGFKPNYACTGHSSQGLTFKDPVTIYGYNNYFCTAEWLYVAGTRTENISDVYYFEGNVQPHGKTEGDLREIIKKKIQSCLAADKLAGRRWSPGSEIAVNDVLELLRTKTNKTWAWHTICPGCNQDMQLVYAKDDPEQFSLDRIDNSLAHVKGNIQILCLRCNKAKH